MNYYDAYGDDAMRLKSLTLENFRCFERLELTFPSRDELVDARRNNDASSQMLDVGTTVLVARNGEGKTAVLDAVADLLGVALSRFPKMKTPKVKNTDFRLTWDKESSVKKRSRPPYVRIAAIAFEGDSAINWDVTLRRDALARYEIPAGCGTKEIFAWSDRLIDRINAKEAPSEPFPFFAYYGAARSVEYKKPGILRTYGKAYARRDGYQDALDGRLDYKKTFDRVYWLESKRRYLRRERGDFDDELLEHKTLQLALEKTTPGFKNLRTDVEFIDSFDLAVDYEDADRFKTCRLTSQLSEGYKNVLALVFDLVTRALILNSELPGITPEQILETPGIVLIDEIELHLYPSWRQRILIDLQRTFPNVQFIVSTQSPLVVSSLPKETLRVLDHGEIIPVDCATEGVESQQILSRIFGVSPAPKENYFVRELKEYAEWEREGRADSLEGREKYERLVAHFGVDYPPLQRIENHRKFIARRKSADA